MSAAAKNLEAIQKAMIQHNGNCEFPILAVLMNPYEVRRLGWDEIQGVPIVEDDSLGTGRFRLLCEGEHDGAPASDEREVVLVGAGETPEPEITGYARKPGAAAWSTIRFEARFDAPVGGRLVSWRLLDG